MLPFHYEFSFPEDQLNKVSGHLELDSPVAYQTLDQATAFYRPGRLVLDDCGNLEILLYHNQYTERFIYVRESPIDRNLIDLMGLSENDISDLDTIRLSGQLCLGAERVQLIGHALRDLTAAPMLCQTIESRMQHNLAIFPIAREGLKYQVAEAIFQNYGYYCDEIVLDAHHVFDSSVPIYNRKVEMTLFKDKDLDQRQKDNISVAFIADSIASGLVMKEVIAKVKERFDHIQQIEVIAPLATIRGLCRVASARCVQDIKVRVHVFETLLNALPPDFYYSAHYNIPEMHICPDLEIAYRTWWGEDNTGKMIADTACAGYGWSEVFFSPRKQIEMINGELESRHQMKIGGIVKRNLR
jgi:hypothetical protein